jgi:hypothetical protein
VLIGHGIELVAQLCKQLGDLSMLLGQRCILGSLSFAVSRGIRSGCVGGGSLALSQKLLGIDIRQTQSRLLAVQFQRRLERASSLHVDLAYHIVERLREPQNIRKI